MREIPLDAPFVERYSRLYNQYELTNAEIELFQTVTERVQEQGFFEKPDFLAVCAWKSTRTKSLVTSNPADRVVEVTRIAFNSSEELRTPILSLLRGVSTPTASALLTVWQPNFYTITDFRVLNSLARVKHDLLRQSELLNLGRSYTKYLGTMRAVSQTLNCDLRSLDKALWMFDKVGSNL